MKRGLHDLDDSLRKEVAVELRFKVIEEIVGVAILSDVRGQETETVSRIPHDRLSDETAQDSVNRNRTPPGRYSSGREVVAGLSRRLPLLSFEFAVEYADGAEAVLDRLEGLGFDSFNFSPEETFSLVWDEWRDVDALRTYLSSLTQAGLAWGDVYAAG